MVPQDKSHAPVSGVDGYEFLDYSYTQYFTKSAGGHKILRQAYAWL